MAYPLPCDDNGTIQFTTARPVLERLIHSASVVAVGPGLGQSDAIRQLVKFLITSAGRPLVIDADGLNALVGQTDLLSGLTHPVIITPHPGEFARLTSATVADVQSDRIARAAELASRSSSLVVVLKGAGTVVTDGLRYYLNTTGNPGMATGGTGDVLTGVIAALLAQKLAPFEAAQLGVFIHGLAGDIARDQNGEIGMIAGDLVDALPDAFVHAMPDPDVVSLGCS
jgi:NAD(P)H-hydrate epimerase